jgi:glucose-fructose oxidoreductase
MSAAGGIQERKGVAMSALKSSRRGFVKGVAGLLACGGKSVFARRPNDRVNLGHIGVGGQGEGLLRHFLGLGDCQCVAVCDPFGHRRERAVDTVHSYYGRLTGSGVYKGCTAYNDFREMLERPDIDAVVIATPDHWHVPIGIAAVRAGKDLYVEKPLGISIVENQAMRTAVRDYGAVFQYGTQQRSQSHLLYGCELVRNGRIGRVHTIEVVAPSGERGGSPEPGPVPEDLDYDLWLGPAPVRPYSHDRCVGVGRYHIYDYALGFIAGWGAHPLDIAQWGNGTDHTSPVEYQGTGVIPKEGLFDTITNWSVECRYADGVRMTFRDGVPDSTRFIGDKGWVAVGREFIDSEPKSLLTSAIGSGEIRLHASSDQKQDFLDSIRRRTQPVSPIEAAVRSDTISHLCDIAVRLGRAIRWDPVKEKIIGDDVASRMLSRPMRSPWRL